jgi:hypothetical protein
VPLVGGLCVVVPVLAAAEFFMSRSTYWADVNWGGALAAAFIALAGSVIAVVVMARCWRRLVEQGGFTGDLQCDRFGRASLR